MHSFFSFAAWSLLLASGVVALARNFQPALFSPEIFFILVIATCACGMLAIQGKRYE